MIRRWPRAVCATDVETNSVPAETVTRARATLPAAAAAAVRRRCRRRSDSATGGMSFFHSSPPPYTPDAPVVFFQGRDGPFYDG